MSSGVVCRLNAGSASPELQNIVKRTWRKQSDQRKVLDKLVACGVLDVAELLMCLKTPPRSARSGSTCLLNESIDQKAAGRPFKSSTIKGLVKECRSVLPELPAGSLPFATRIEMFGRMAPPQSTIDALGCTLEEHPTFLGGRRGGVVPFAVQTGELRGVSGLRSLEAVLAAVKGAGQRCDVNRSCGFSVSVNVSSLRFSEVRALCGNWVKFERCLDSVLPPSRREDGEGRCLSVHRAIMESNGGGSGGDHRAALAAVLRCGSVSELRRVCNPSLRLAATGSGGGSSGGGSRYKLEVRGGAGDGGGALRLLFRSHGGTLSGSKAVYWVRLLLWLAAASAQRPPRRSLSGGGSGAGDLRKLFDLVVRHGELRAHYLRRAEALAATVGPAAAAPGAAAAVGGARGRATAAAASAASAAGSSGVAAAGASSGTSPPPRRRRRLSRGGSESKSNPPPPPPPPPAAAAARTAAPPRAPAATPAVSSSGGTAVGRAPRVGASTRAAPAALLPQEQATNYAVTMKRHQFASVSTLEGHAFAQQAGSEPGFVPPARLRRLTRELRKLKASSLPCTDDAVICLRVSSQRPWLLRALITGPRGGPYYGGAFVFDLYCPPGYPRVPPKALLTNATDGRTRFSPNIYCDGKVCLSLLGTWGPSSWSSQSSLLQVLVSLQSLVLGVDLPYFNEPGRNAYNYDVEQTAQSTAAAAAGGGSSHGGFHHAPHRHPAADPVRFHENGGLEVVRLATVRYAILEQLRHPCPQLQQVLRLHFRLRHLAIRTTIQQWIADSRNARFSNALKQLLPQVEAQLTIAAAAVQQ